MTDAKPAIDWRSLLHRYICHVRREEGWTYMPYAECDSDYFGSDEIVALLALDKEKPTDVR